MKIFIINLRRSVERKNHMQMQIGKLACGYEFIFFEAIDANLKQHELFIEHYSNFTKFIKGRALTDGEFACFASHYSLWSKCVELNEPIVVLEDDVVLLPHFCQAVDKIIKSNYVYVKLAGTFNKKQYEIESNFAITYCGVSGTQGYYITPHTARQVIAKSVKWCKPVDDYLDSFWIHNTPTIIYTPKLLDSLEESVSTIKNRRQKIKFVFKILRETTHLLLKIRKFIFLKKYKFDNEHKVFAK